MLAAVKQTVEDVRKDIEVARDNKKATDEELIKLEAVLKKV